jgi:hypothetical protein
MKMVSLGILIIVEIISGKDLVGKLLKKTGKQSIKKEKVI